MIEGAGKHGVASRRRVIALAAIWTVIAAGILLRVSRQVPPSLPPPPLPPRLGAALLCSSPATATVDIVLVPNRDAIVEKCRRHSRHPQWWLWREHNKRRTH
jgi:hypothetical protein